MFSKGLFTFNLDCRSIVAAETMTPFGYSFRFCIQMKLNETQNYCDLAGGNTAISVNQWQRPWQASYNSTGHERNHARKSRISQTTGAIVVPVSGDFSSRNVVESLPRLHTRISFNIAVQNNDFLPGYFRQLITTIIRRIKRRSGFSGYGTTYNIVFRERISGF